MLDLTMSIELMLKVCDGPNVTHHDASEPGYFYSSSQYGSRPKQAIPSQTTDDS
jgi:hypothetical protein